MATFSKFIPVPVSVPVPGFSFLEKTGTGSGTGENRSPAKSQYNSPTLRPRLLLIALLATSAFARDFAVKSAPSWVERLDVDTKVTVAKEHVRWGIYDILSDHQARVRGGSTSHYYRMVRSVLSPSGVQNASELELDFDPSFEKLTIHDIAVVRNGKRTRAFDPGDVRVIDKEESSSDRMYDGEQTALIFLKDVRPGDVIDYSWSLDGANPLLDGKFADAFSLSSSVPSRRIRHSLSFPASRTLHWRGLDPKVETRGDEQILTWERSDVHALDVEDAIPSWYEPWDYVQLSEFTSWNDVARWSDAMFQLDDNSTAEVTKLADTIRAENAGHDAQITAAIRFVQDDVRYLGIEMGRNSHEPHQPSETLAHRWGDCKDKSFLLASLLRQLGIEAYPALVNTRLGHKLDTVLPSPFIFDHVIVQAIADGKTQWIDGTISEQGGNMATMETPSYGYALVIRPETAKLAEIITNQGGSTLIEQTYTTRDAKLPVALLVRSTYSGADADAMRSTLAAYSRDDWAKERINDLAADQPKIESTGEIDVKDDRAKNTIVVTERYRVRDLWNEGDWSWYPRDLDAHLQRPNTIVRSMPLEFEYPLNITQVVTFNFPKTVDIEDSNAVTETKTFRYEYNVDGQGQTVVIRQSLRALKDSVAVADVSDHLTKLNDIWDEIGYQLRPELDKVPAASKIQQASVAHWTWGLGGVVLAVFIACAIAIPISRRRRSIDIDFVSRPGDLAPRPGQFSPGEAPASALALAHADDLHLQLNKLACPCGARIDSPPDIQHARYDEREMTIVTRQCRICGREQSVYFTAA